MKTHCLLISLAVLSGVLTVEVPEDYAKLLSSKLLQELEKRLDERHNKEPKCQYETRRSTIIRTNASLSAGAEFLKAPDNVESQRECLQECCYKEKCSVAVYQTKDSSCYLFNCRKKGICQFTSSSKYNTMILEDRLITSDEDASENKFIEEEDAQPSTTTSSTTAKATAPTTTTAAPTTASTTTTTTTTTTTATTTTERTTVTEKHTTKPKEKTKVPLLNLCSAEENICETAHSHCKDSFCQCMDGYHAKNGVCRRDCDPNFQWECTNGKASYVGENCIAKYDRCDGIAQCPDGSDEENCIPKEHNNKMSSIHSGNKNGHGYHTNQHGSNQHGYYPSNSEQENAGKEEKEPTPTPEPKKEDEVEDAKEEKVKDGKEDTGPTEMPPKDVNDVDSKGKETPAVLVPTSPSPSTSEEVKPGEESSSKQPATEHQQDLPSNQVKTPNSSVDLLNQVTEEEEQAASSRQGPILALSLGLTVMALLLLFVGCKYRNMKRKLRRGKPLNSNEADYLINGMYL